MQTLARIAAPLAFAATVLAPALFFAGTLDEDRMKAVLLTATFAWFAAAPIWMKGGQ
jgi:hypothetical protein